MGLVLGAALLVVAVPMTGVALRAGGARQRVVEFEIDVPAVPARAVYDTAGPRQAGASPGSGNGN